MRLHHVQAARFSPKESRFISQQLVALYSFSQT